MAKTNRVSRNASHPKSKGGGNNNPSGKGGFADRPQDRNAAGQRNAEAVAFSRSLRELLVIIGDDKHSVTIEGKQISKRNIEWMIDSLWRKARSGDMAAVQFIAERVEGKVTQPLEQSGELVIRIVRDSTPSANAASSAAANQK